MTRSLAGKARRGRRGLLAVAVVVLALGALGLAVFRGLSTRGLSRHSLVSQGRKRVFYVHLPPGHSKTRPVPLVLALHGNGGSAALLNRGTREGLTREADARGWVLVLPQGIDESWNDHRPFKQNALAGVDDVAFLTGLVDHARNEHGIDPTQVFVVGVSNGGAMAMTLAVERSERFRAIAAVVMSLPGIHEQAAPRQPISVLMVNGTEDPIVPFQGGQILGKRGLVLSTPASLDWWARQDHCSRKVPSRPLADADPSDGTRVSHEIREGCADGTSVDLYEITGGGHSWPGGRPHAPERVVGRTSRDVDASKLIFDFFAKHARP